jgi:aminopeptidase
MGVPEYNPNLPSEEVFCMPHKYHVNGTVVSTKPLNYNGQLINNFKLTFKDGEIVKHEAQQGGDVLKKIIDTDAGSKRIGEVALVSYNSPISNSGVLFFETLYDENASCHLAIGSSYPINVVKGTKMSKHKKDKVGANTSALHIDFMFGSKDMNCVGTTKSGQKVQIMKDGEIDLKSISTTEKAIKD